MKCLPIFGLLCVALVVFADTHGSNAQCDDPARLLIQLPVCVRKCNDADASTGYSDSEEPKNHSPLCFNSYCAHAVQHYRGARSLTIIGTSQAARSVATTREYAVRAPNISQHDRYDIRVIPGKGKGVIATHRIAKGEVLMLDAPAMIASARAPMHIAPSEGARLFERAMQMLDSATKDEVLTLDGHGSTGIDGIVETNAFSCRFDDGDTGDDYLCLFPEVSRINHACRPNANAKFSAATLLMEIRALRDILPGEEISISYGKVELKYAERKQLYRENWGFECTCELCAAGQKAVAESDARRERFAELHQRLDTLTAETFDVHQVIAWEEEVLAISEQEGMEVLVAEDLERMAYVQAALGNRIEAVSWARKARDNILRWKVDPDVGNDDVRRLDELLGEWTAR